jgi:hypothetical protein
MNLVTCGTIRIIREGSDREEACIGHPRVSKHLFVDDSRQHVMLSRNPSASLTRRCILACTGLQNVNQSFASNFMARESEKAA